MPESSFFERAEELLERVGEGDLTGTTRVDQPYAYNQHEGGWINFMGRYGAKDIERHSDGSQPPSRFLAEPFDERAPEFMQRLADATLEGDLVEEMAQIQEDLCSEVQDRAPVKDSVLRRSAAPAVFDNGVQVYGREPAEPRRGR